MKKLVCVVIVLLILALTACSAPSSSTPIESEAPTITAAPTPEPTAIPTPEPTVAPVDGQLGDYMVKYVKHTIVKDYEKKPALAVYYEFTSNHDDPVAFLFAVKADAYQGGVQLESAILLKPAAENKNLLNKIQKGTTVTVCEYYKIADETADVNLEISELISFDDTAKIEKTIKLQ